jgi:hypothetical protein
MFGGVSTNPLAMAYKSIESSSTVRIKPKAKPKEHINYGQHGHRSFMQNVQTLVIGERARCIAREITYSGLQEHRNTNKSTERALEH